MQSAWALGLIVLALPLAAEDWPEWRGPRRDGTSVEKGLIEKWSLTGENLAWKAPYGARSAPVVFGNRVFLQTSSGKGPTLQERVVALDADTGRLAWEYRWNLYMSDVPPHRISWASPAVDSATGNVIVFGGNGLLTALNSAGKPIWQRSLVEDFGLFTTHGGRTASPLIDGDLVIVGAIASTWGAMANRSHRLMAFDKRTGATVWVSTPGGRPYDTAYSNPVIADVDGTRLLIQGLGDGSVIAVKPQTGEPVWRLEVCKRGINSPVVIAGRTAIFSHSEENLASSELGMVGAFDISGKGALKLDALKWNVKGVEAGFSGPLLDGDRTYLLDNSANLLSFDVQTGRTLWKKTLGTVQKASPVLADGKIYVGTENGKFYILKPHGDSVEVLSEVQLPVSKEGSYSQGTPEPILASAAVAHGRVYFASVDTLYALGPKAARKEASVKPAPLPPGQGAPAYLQVRPTELVLKPGESVQLHALAYDAQGRLLREVKPQWAASGVEGTLADGKFTAATGKSGQAGLITATLDNLKGESRVRLTRAIPYAEDFESAKPGTVSPEWISGATGKYQVQELEGGKVLAKLPDETIFRRMRVFFGPNDLHDYTVEADVRAVERRRQLGDVGIFAQRYALVLFGNGQTLDLMPWQPETQRTVAVPFEWKKDAWYRLKLRVENQAGGAVHVQAKAWPREAAEPSAWLIDKTDPIGNREGSPGIFGDSQFGLFYDNLKVTANQ